MTPIVAGTFDGPGEQVVKPAIVYNSDGSTENIYILHRHEDQQAKRHYRITQIYMIVSIVAIIITSSVALFQIKKSKI